MLRTIALGFLAGFLSLGTCGSASAQDRPDSTQSGPPNPTDAPINTVPGRSVALVLDASGSMKARLPDGVTRMEAAKDAVAKLVATLPADTRLSFRAYGHQSPTSAKDCKDTALLVPFAEIPINKGAVVDRAHGLEPRGYTPITHALTQAAEDLGSEESASRVVVLVSDGKETCKADPCAAAKALAKDDAKLIVHTVGVGVDEVTRDQLECIASNARGTYFSANSAADLGKVMGEAAVKDAVAETKPKKQQIVTGPRLGKLKLDFKSLTTHEIINESGVKVDEFRRDIFRHEVDLPAGIYSVKFGNGVWSGIEVKPGETKEIKPAFLTVDPITVPTGEVHVLDVETGEIAQTLFHGRKVVTLIPGQIELNFAKFGDMMWPVIIELEAGNTTIRPGIVRVKTKLKNLEYSLTNSKGNEARSQTLIDAGIALPPGKYRLEVDPDRHIPTIPAEQRIVEIDLKEGDELEILVQ